MMTSQLWHGQQSQICLREGAAMQIEQLRGIFGRYEIILFSEIEAKLNS
jgi:hypothetical protein